ncbi:hypothetical protein [[Eubacterium] cellulosolvens]
MSLRMNRWMIFNLIRELFTRFLFISALFLLFSSLLLPAIAVSVNQDLNNSKIIKINSENLEDNGTELLTNGDFELGFTNWTKSEYYPARSIYLTNGTAHSGESALLIFPPPRRNYALGGEVYQDVKGLNELDLEFSFWIKPYAVGKNPFTVIQSSAIFETSFNRTLRINYVIAWYPDLKTPGNHTDETDFTIRLSNETDDTSSPSVGIIASVPEDDDEIEPMYWVFVKRSLRQDFESKFELNEKENISAIRIKLETMIMDAFDAGTYWDDISLTRKLYSFNVKVSGLKFQNYTDLFFNNSTIKVNDGESIELEYVPNQNCTISVLPHTQEDSGVRSTCIENSFVCEPNNEYHFQYSTEYFLNASTELSNVIGEGWYQEGDLAILSIESNQVEVNDTQYIFKGWVGDIESNKTAITIEMDGPKNISAIWEQESTKVFDETDYRMVVIILIILAIIFTSIILFHRKSKAAKLKFSS